MAAAAVGNWRLAAGGQGCPAPAAVPMPAAASAVKLPMAQIPPADAAAEVTAAAAAALPAGAPAAAICVGSPWDLLQNECKSSKTFKIISKK
jgi:hypothetical protein